MGASNKAGGRLTTDAGWQLPFASFVNPTYIGPPDRNTGVVPSTGFALGSSAGLVIQFSGTYAGVTLVHEQTLDPDGATGWFPVAGQVISGAPGTPGSGLAATGSAYCFPSFGALHRIRVTAMASGTVIVFAGLIYDVYDVSTAGGGGGGGGGDVNITEVGGNAVTDFLPVAVATVAPPTYGEADPAALSLDLDGNIRTRVDDGANVVLGSLTSAAWNGSDLSHDVISLLIPPALAALSTDPARMEGATAADAALTARPVTTGGLAKTALPTAVADADVVNALRNKFGAAVSIGALREQKAAPQVTTITSSTAETTVLTAVASTLCDVYGIIVANSSATPTTVTFRDATGGTVRAVVRVPANGTAGISLTVDSAIPQAAANNNWTATCADSVASIIVTMLSVRTT